MLILEQIQQINFIGNLAQKINAVTKIFFVLEKENKLF